MLVDGIEISERDTTDLILTNKEVFGTWVSIISSFLFLKSASDNRIIIENKYTNEIPKEQEPDPILPIIIALVLSVFVGVWFTYILLQRLDELNKENAEGGEQTSTEPTLIFIFGSIIYTLSVGIKLKAALQKEGLRTTPQIFIS